MVVYFDKHLGVAHSKCRSKNAFSTPFVQKSWKWKKKQEIGFKIYPFHNFWKHSNTLFHPFHNFRKHLIPWMVHYWQCFGTLFHQNPVFSYLILSSISTRIKKLANRHCDLKLPVFWKLVKMCKVLWKKLITVTILPFSSKI